MYTKNENARRDSDMRPKMHSDLPPRKKGFYMDEAIGKTNFGSFNYFLIGLCGMIFYVVAMEICGIAYILPMLECDLSLTPGEKGILSGAALFGIICSSHLWGYLSDTKGRRAVMMPTLFLAFVFSFASTFVQDFYLFAVLRFLNGFFISGCSATTYVYLGEFHNNARRSQAIMGSVLFLSIVCLAIPIVAWAVINQEWQFDVPVAEVTYKPWRLYLVVCSLPEVIISLILYYLPETPKFVLGQGNKMAAYKILQKMHRWNNGKKVHLQLFEIYEESDAIENRERVLACKQSRFPLLKSIWNQTAPLFKPPYLNSTLLICFIQFGTYCTFNGLFMFFAEINNKMAAHMNDDRIMMCDVINMKPANMSLVDFDDTNEQVCATKLEFETLLQVTVLEIMYATGTIVIGLLINRIRKFSIMFSILVACGSCAFVCVLTDIPMLQVYLFSVLISSGLALNVLNAVAVELYPTALRAMAMCISLMFGRMGGVVGANAAAILLANHCEIVFYLSGSSLIVMGILAFFIPNIHEKPSKTEEPYNNGRISIMSFRVSVISM